MLSHKHYAAIAFVIALFAYSQAKARELYSGQYANVPPAIKKWYGEQRNKAGGSCCEHADGHDFYGYYKLNDDGSVEFDADGQHRKLPAYMVLDGPNPTGHAVWWWIDWQTDIGTIHSDYCFALGAGG
jgi:hypothetical protein